MLYPILTKSRVLIDLSGTWNFKMDTGRGMEEKWYASPLEGAIPMCVPASYNDLREGVDFREHVGFVFYQRRLEIPEYLKSERIVLRLSAVTHIAKVYLNDALIAEHKGGFLPFEVELNPDDIKEENLLTIAVDNRIDHSTLPVGREDDSEVLGGSFWPYKPSRNQIRPNFDFFNYAGITRPVKIYTTPKDYISDITLVSEVIAKNATVKYKIDTVGSGDVKIEVFTECGKLVASATGNEGELKIENVHLWQPLHAYLYDVKVTFKNDEYSLPYGIRTVRVDGGMFLINEEPFYFKGYGKHEDTFPAGRGLNMAMNVKDMSLMKWQGANSFRTSHYPYSEEMMRLADREGFVVIDETPAVGVHLNFGGGANATSKDKANTFAPEDKGGIRTFAHHKEVIRDLIARDKNHACVVMWSLANESDSGSVGAYEYFKPLYELAREADPEKRPCTMVSVQMANYKDDCTIKLSDVICLNRYWGWYAAGCDLAAAEKALREEMEFWNSLGKPFMFTEYGADTVSGFHDTTDSMYTEEYQVEYYKMNHRVVDTLKNFVGEQVWNFADFATTQGLLRVQGNKKGLFTRERRPKMAAHYFKDRWHSIPDFDYKK